MKFLAIVGADLLILASLSGARMRPSDKDDKPFWRDCTELKPFAQADDGSDVTTCTDLKGNRYEIVVRSYGRTCTETVSKDKDAYRHFQCQWRYELMMRPERKDDK